MGRSKNDLLESDDVWVPQRPMIYYLSSNIFINLVATLDVPDGNELPGLSVRHQPGDPEVFGPNIWDEIIPVAVVHDRHIHGWPNRHCMPIHFDEITSLPLDQSRSH
ncbi:hypothetical protein ACFX13_040110 [Malus domestica]